MIHYLSSGLGDMGGVLGVTKEGLNAFAWSNTVLVTLLSCMTGPGNTGTDNITSTILSILAAK